MNKKHMKLILEAIANQIAPEEKINLWPSIENKLLMDHAYENKELSIRDKSYRINHKSLLRQSLVLTIILMTLVSVAIFFTSTQGKVIGQNLVQFFTKSEVNLIALPKSTSTPLVSEPTEFTAVSPLVVETKVSAEKVATPDPKSILDAKKQIAEVQELVEYNLEVPDWIPVNLIFSGASIEEGDGNQIVRIFYSINDSDQDYYTNGLVLRQQLIPVTGNCELCTIVGADAFIQEVSISGSYGEYVEGVWKYTEKGIVWEPDPYLKRLRWQNEGMAFELLFMGPPEMFLVDDLVKIAEIIN
jgi:hypothetical protein